MADYIDIIKKNYKKYKNEEDFIIDETIVKDLESLFRLPKTPDTKQKSNKHKQPLIPINDRAKILSPIESVFFEDELMDDLIVRTSIPQLLDRQAPMYPGVILFGPPGTGKSEFQKAICEVYENAGAYAKQVSTSAVNSCFVGEFAKNLEKELQVANEQGEINGLPSLLSFDEGSILAEQAKQGANSVAKHYQEAIDTMKRYLGNDCGKWLVLAISTNQLPEDFEKAMTREGRLTSFLIGYPNQKQIERMWKHFASKYNVLGLKEGQAIELAKLTPNTQGAFIEQFCRGYLSQKRQAILVSKGYSGMLDALKSGENVSESEIKETITYEQFTEDIKNYLNRAEMRNGDRSRIKIGFRH